MHSRTEILNTLIRFQQTYWKGRKPLEKVRNTLWIIQIDPRAIYTVGCWTLGTAKELLELHGLVNTPKRLSPCSWKNINNKKINKRQISTQIFTAFTSVRSIYLFIFSDQSKRALFTRCILCYSTSPSLNVVLI